MLPSTHNDDSSTIPYPPQHPTKHSTPIAQLLPISPNARPRASSGSSTSTVTSEKSSEFFTTSGGRQINSMSRVYKLPADDEEKKRLDYEYRMVNFILGGKNYLGPVADVLSPKGKSVKKGKNDKAREADTSDQPPKRILDCGTGSGQWAIDVADEFPKAQVIGVDLAPTQPREVPPNCTFELFDLDGQRLPYPDDWFDVVHARSLYTGIQNYQLFLEEVSRILRPGGIILLAEVEVTPMTDEKRPITAAGPNGAPGWFKFWDIYQKGLKQQGIDTTIPTKLRTLLRESKHIENVVAKEALIPIGFWPQDPSHLTIGQLSWMAHDNFLLAVRPFFVHIGLSAAEIDKVISDAQTDLYQPRVRPSCCWHFVYGRKQGPKTEEKEKPLVKDKTKDKEKRKKSGGTQRANKKMKGD